MCSLLRSNPCSLQPCPRHPDNERKKANLLETHAVNAYSSTQSHLLLFVLLQQAAEELLGAERRLAFVVQIGGGHAESGRLIHLTDDMICLLTYRNNNGDDESVPMNERIVQ